jgi:hypothetical protein
MITSRITPPPMYISHLPTPKDAVQGYNGETVDRVPALAIDAATAAGVQRWRA